jgi:16S rRNA (cytosine1402-N4)-methyltransferase
MSGEHKPVFLNEIIEGFRAHSGLVRNFFDGTFGRGGHTRAVLEAFPQAVAWVMDGDKQAIEFGRQNFAAEVTSGRLHLLHQSYSDFNDVQKRLGSEGFPREFDLMLLDLGVSSPQLDQAERGFSFYQDGPLDMRMNQNQEITAATIISEWDEQDLARLFIELGEVQRPFRVVRAIVNDRLATPYQTTRDLASLIERVDGWHKKGSHPATKYFMALRLKVNEELSSLEIALPKLIAALAEHGLLAVISFHSLEDRIVKNTFKAHLDVGRMVNKKVIVPTDEEIKENSRARSAKLRIFAKGNPQMGPSSAENDDGDVKFQSKYAMKQARKQKAQDGDETNDGE